MQETLPFKAKRAMLIFFTAWLIISLAAPFTLQAGSVTDLSGVAGREDNAATIGRMNPFAATVYLIGDVNCHQLKDRSFFLNGNQMPYCARDTGIFIGLAIGMLLLLLLSPKFSWLALIALCIPILADGGIQLITNYESTNLLRLITGLLGGVGAAYFLGHIADVSLTVKSKGPINAE
jgi:uncharacterized membrane protein